MRPAALILVLAANVAARADVVELKNGGRVEGKVIDDVDRNSIFVELTGGGRLVIERGQASRVVKLTPADEEYLRKAPATPDTAAAQWALAMWCRDQKLEAELQRHLQRVVELDPTHDEARQLLGFRQVDGQWLTSDEIMQSRGMVLYEGSYYTPQDIELFERNKLVKEKEFAWKANIERWRKWLDDRDPARVAEARQQFRALRDPMAASNLVRILEKEKNEAVRLLLIEAAAQIPSQLTLEALVKISLEDPNEELRLQALEYLVEGGGSRAVPVYIKALKSNENPIVNRAAVALGSLGDPGAIGPLIDALVTKHQRVVGNPSQGDTYSFSPNDNGFGFGGGGPKILKGELRNPDVRSALVKLAGGANFDYDADAWRAWLGTRSKVQTADLRRDE
jgi:hypothetical protein